MSDIELRAMVRDVLRDVLAKGNHGKAAGLIAQARQVALTTDKEVADFVTMLIAMIDDPATGNAVRTGQVKVHRRRQCVGWCAPNRPHRAARSRPGNPAP